ncbi:MAG: ribbon-helix-helix protein, CopG family [Nitrospirae bacterium]|nr:ribbon-helix-helix protein, CopG family [Nitrospirota bacterium]
MRTTKVTTLSLPPEMVKEVERLTREEKRTKSELFREALRKYINDRRWQQLRQWGMKTAQESGISTEEEVDELIHKHRMKIN